MTRIGRWRPCTTSRPFAVSSSRLPASANSLFGASMSMPPRAPLEGRCGCPDPPQHRHAFAQMRKLASRRLRGKAAEGLMPGITMIAEDDIEALNAWFAKAGLRGEPEAALVNGFCERAVAAGVPISRALLLVDTLHPIYEGRLVRWGYGPSEPAVRDYGRTHLPEGTADRHLLAEQSEHRALACKPVLLHVADRRELAAPPRDKRERSRVSRAGGSSGGRHDGLPRHHQPLRARRSDRRDGLHLLLLVKREPRRLRRCTYRRA